MGHWSTYSRRGGGPPTAVALNFMEIAALFDPFVIDVQYHDDVLIAGFNPADFKAMPTEIFANSLAQQDVDVIRLTFLDDVSQEAALTYSGTKPGILTPQTVDVS